MQRFINPYNFISLSDKPQRQQEAEGQKYTGSVTYRLRTRSSLFIPNTSSNKAFSYTPDKEDDPRNEHGLYDFFSYEILDPDKVYDGQYFEPVIPGSEVRGMLRSIYETLTNSCLPVMDGEKRIGKRTVEHFKPAVLKWEHGHIYLHDVLDKRGRPKGEALYRDRSDFSDKKHLSCQIRDGMKVSFSLAKKESGNAFAKPDVEEISETPGKYPHEGYILKGNQGKKHSPEIVPNKNSKCGSCVMRQRGKCPGNRDSKVEHCFLAEKHCAHVFYIPPDTDSSFRLNTASRETLRLVLEQYMKEDPDSYREYEISYKEFMAGRADGLPVYYSRLDDTDYVMLSPACITREVYKNTVNTLVDEYRRCNSRERKLCPACRLFGIVNSDVAQGSRIRFSDLHPSAKRDCREYYDKKLLTLDPLAVPHPENTEFYLKKPEAKPIDPDGEVWFWTYDYYTVKNRNNQVIVKSYQPQISGRKFYWNNLTPARDCGKKTALNRTVRTVRPGVEFTGTIYFDGISKRQLDQLLYILMYTSDGKHGYKLGTGKPLGLGSVELSIDNARDVSIRMFDEKGYHCTHMDDLEKIHQSTFEELGMDTRTEKPFELITRYLRAEEMACIHYPRTGDKEDEEGFQWFMKNKVYHKYDKKTRQVGFVDPGGVAAARIQMEVKTSLPTLDGGEVPWLPSDPQAVSEKKPDKGRNDNRKKEKDRTAWEPKKTYRVRITSQSRPARNEYFYEYDIEVLSEPALNKKSNIITAKKKIFLKPGDEVEAVMFREGIFNLKQ